MANKWVCVCWDEVGLAYFGGVCEACEEDAREMERQRAEDEAAAGEPCGGCGACREGEGDCSSPQ